MRISRLAFILLSLFVIFQVVSCCGADDNPSPPIVDGGDVPTCAITPDLKSNMPYYKVYADENLPVEYRTTIYNSLEEWCHETNYTLRFNLEFIDMSKQEPTTSTAHTIQVYVKDPGPGLAGWATWRADIFGAYMLIGPGMDTNTFRKVMLHELGHSYNLSFDGDTHYKGPYQSVMYPSIGDSSEHLSCPELKSFCNNYQCEVDCTFVAKSNEQTEDSGEKDYRLF